MFFVLLWSKLTKQNTIMMETYSAKPQLDLVEAAKLAVGRIMDFKGRSRRSEFWWWIVLVLLVNIGSSYLIGNNIYLSTVASIVIMFFGLSVTVRRLHDMGQSGIWVYLSYAMGIATHAFVVFSDYGELMSELAAMGISIKPQDLEYLMEDYSGTIYTYLGLWFVWSVLSVVVVVMCFFDSKKQPNKYGESPKYYKPLEAEHNWITTP